MREGTKYRVGTCVNNRPSRNNCVNNRPQTTILQTRTSSCALSWRILTSCRIQCLLVPQRIPLSLEGPERRPVLTPFAPATNTLPRTDHVAALSPGLGGRGGFPGLVGGAHRAPPEISRLRRRLRRPIAPAGLSVQNGLLLGFKLFRSVAVDLISKKESNSSAALR